MTAKHVFSALYFSTFLGMGVIGALASDPRNLIFAMAGYVIGAVQVFALGHK